MCLVSAASGGAEARPDAELVCVVRVRCVRVGFVTGKCSLEGT